MASKSDLTAIYLSLKRGGPGTRSQIAQRTGFAIVFVGAVLDRWYKEGKISRNKVGGYRVYAIPLTKEKKSV